MLEAQMIIIIILIHRSYEKPVFRLHKQLGRE